MLSEFLFDDDEEAIGKEVADEAVPDEEAADIIIVDDEVAGDDKILVCSIKLALSLNTSSTTLA